MDINLNSMKTETFKTTSNGQGFSKMNRIFLTSALFLMIAFQSILGQNLDDFKQCAGLIGVESIPYSDLKAKAKSAEDAKVRAFEEAKEYGFGTLEGPKTKILKDLAAAKKLVLNNQKKLAIDKEDYPSITSPYEAKLSESQSLQEDLEEDLEDINEKISEGISRYKTLLAGRITVREAFAEVDKELDYSLNRPEEHIGPAPSSSDTDDDRRYYESKLASLRGYISTIGYKMDEAAAGHQTAENDTGKAITNLEQLLALN